ncbi:hypothetical protein IAT38_007810 [Cryptococcus sp. DSM 104549]
MAHATAATLPKAGRVSSRKRGPSGPPTLLRGYADPRSSQDAQDRPQTAHPYATQQALSHRAPPPPPLDQLGYRHPSIPAALPSPPARTSPSSAAHSTPPLAIRPRMSSAPVVPSIAHGPLPPTPLDGLPQPPSADRTKPRVSSRPRPPGAKPQAVYMPVKDEWRMAVGGGATGSWGSTRPILEAPPPPRRRPSMEAAAVLDRREAHPPAETVRPPSREREPQPTREDRSLPTRQRLPSPMMVPLKIEHAGDRPAMGGRAMSAPPMHAPASPPSEARAYAQENGGAYPHAESSAAAGKKAKKAQHEALGVRSMEASRSLDIGRSLDAGRSMEASRKMNNSAGDLSGGEEGGSGERRPSGGKSMKKKSTAALRALFGRGASGKGKKWEDAPAVPAGMGKKEREWRGVTPTPTSRSADDLNASPSATVGRLTPTPNLHEGRVTPTPPAPVGQRLEVSPIPKARAPSRELPPPPEASPIPSPTFAPSSSPQPPSLPPVLPPIEPTPKTPPMAPFLPTPTSSLPQPPARTPLSAGRSPGSQRRPATSPEVGSSPSTPPRRYKLDAPSQPRLQLPELDLDFHIEFDKYGLSPSSASRSRASGSPLKSNGKSRHSPLSPPSPARSHSQRSPRMSPSPRSLQRSMTVVDRTAGNFHEEEEGGQGGSPGWLDVGSGLGGSGRSLVGSPLLGEPLFGEGARGRTPSPLLPPPSVSALEHSPSPPPMASMSSFHVPSSDDHASTDTSTHETASPALPVTPDENAPSTAADASLGVGASTSANGGFGEISLAMSITNSVSSSSTVAAGQRGSPEVGAKKKLREGESGQDGLQQSVVVSSAPVALALAPPANIQSGRSATVPPPGKMLPPPPPAASTATPGPTAAEPTTPDPKPTPARTPRKRLMNLVTRSQTSIPDKHLTIPLLAAKAEEIRVAFKYPEAGMTSADRTAMLRSELVPLVQEVDRRAYEEKREGEYEGLREVVLKWIGVLVGELRVERQVDERGSVLESLAALFESIPMSEAALRLSPTHQEKFMQVTAKCMAFVMDKLGGRGVFQNILVFSGRFLAFAFFRVPHVAHQLLQTLALPRGALMRFTANVPEDGGVPPEYEPKFPDHLQSFCFDNVVSYNKRIASHIREHETEEERNAFLFPPGYWLRRWQSDDSELFPSFYRAYHRQLATYLGPAVKYCEAQNRPVPASVLMRTPGYAHLATVFAKKMHSYILGTVNAVTTCSSNASFDATESALQAPNAKPPVLVTANRRLVETLMTFADQRACVPVGREVIDCEGSQLYMAMIDLWTKNLISKTSMNAPRGVFCLFDLLDGIVDPPWAVVAGAPAPRTETVVDVPFLIHVIRMLLTETEHAMTIVKVIAFVFSHWEVLTAKAEDRRELCLELLLDKDIFERLLLFWSHSVRSYVLRLVVFRLGHLETTNAKKRGPALQVEIQTVRLLQTRLDAIKKRHDELEPKPEGGADPVDDIVAAPFSPLSPFGGEEFNMPRSRSTITMVADAPSPPTGSADKAERLLGLGFGALNAPRGEIDIDPVVAAGTKLNKAAKWLKKNFGNKKKGKGGGGAGLAVTPDANENSPTFSTDSESPGLEPSPELFDAPPRQERQLGSSPLVELEPSSPEQPASGAAAMANELTTTPPRKAKPPTIITTSALPARSHLSFEFELPTMSPRSDTFDPAPAATPTSPRRNSQPPPPSPRKPPSPRMSKSFSKRSSLLPPSTASALDSIMESEKEREERKRAEKEEKERVRMEKGYDKRLHPYAVRMLGELEDAQKEYDEWWSEGGYGKIDGLPPRLTVAWPFHDGED